MPYNDDRLEREDGQERARFIDPGYRIEYEADDSPEALPTDTASRQRLREIDKNAGGSVQMEDERLTADAILEQLSIDAPLIPIARGTKRPTRKGINRITFAESRDPKFIRSLNRCGAVAVRLGKVSDGLCVIDFDTDDAGMIAEFFRVNPKLESSLITKGNRGLGIWVQIDGEFPSKIFSLKSKGEQIGEWRGAQHSIITGVHPSGSHYQIVHKSKPVWLEFEDIVWPDFIDKKPSNYQGRAIDHFAKCHTDIAEVTDQRKKGEPLENRGDDPLTTSPAWQRMQTTPGLADLYQIHILNRVTPKAGQRNTTITQVATFLFYAVSEEKVLQMATAFHDLNRHIFTDPLRQHLAEVKASIDYNRAAYEEGLSEGERNAIDSLATATRTQLTASTLSRETAFRICRDLARRDAGDPPFGQFFLSTADLGRRLEIDGKDADRILKLFTDLKIIHRLAKGTLKGRRASCYEWILPGLERRTESTS